MMIGEIKDYFVDKKENIKTGAKKAVATGLVISTLFGGSTMITACNNKCYDTIDG